MDREMIKRMANIVHDWMRGLPFPTDVPVMAISYCMDELLKRLDAEETNKQ